MGLKSLSLPTAPRLLLYWLCPNMEPTAQQLCPPTRAQKSEDMAVLVSASAPVGQIHKGIMGGPGMALSRAERLTFGGLLSNVSADGSAHSGGSRPE